MGLPFDQDLTIHVCVLSDRALEVIRDELKHMAQYYRLTAREAAVLGICITELAERAALRQEQS